MAATSESRDSLHADERQESLQNPVNDTTGPVDQEKSVPDVADFGPAPEGGTRAWLVAAGGAGIFFCTLGFANSFGAFQEYYMTHQLHNEQASKISWIGSLQTFLQFLSGMVGGPLFDRFGAKVVRPAAIVYVFAMMMLSLCKTYWQIMLVQGVLMGSVMGLLQLPAFAAVSQYFEKNRAGALGLVMSGSSIGGVVMPIILSKMLNSSSLGFGWSVRVVGFLILPFMIFACVSLKARLPRRETQFWVLEAFKDARYILLIIALFFLFFGMFTPFFYLPSYAVSQGMNPTLAGYLLAILNASSTFGRIIPGVLADKYGRINAFALGGAMTGVTIFCMNSAKSNPGLIVYAIFIGFASGTIISGAGSAFSLCPKDTRNVGTYMGMGLALSGIGGLIGPPVMGAIVSRYHGHYFEVSMLSGALCLFGGFVALLAKLATPEGILGNV